MVRCPFLGLSAECLREDDDEEEGGFLRLFRTPWAIFVEGWCVGGGRDAEGGREGGYLEE